MFCHVLCDKQKEENEVKGRVMDLELLPNVKSYQTNRICKPNYNNDIPNQKAREEREAGMMTISSQPREEASYSRLKALTHYHAPAGREALLAARHREKRAQVLIASILPVEIMEV